MLNIGGKNGRPHAIFVPHITVGLFLRVSVVWADECGFQQVRVLTRLASLFEHSHPQQSHRERRLKVCDAGGKRKSVTPQRRDVRTGVQDTGVGVLVLLSGMHQ